MITVDTREATGAPKIVENLRKCGAEIREEYLPVGDYLFQSGVCIERKTVFDFVRSVKDKTLWKQLEGIKSSEGIIPILMIEKPLTLLEKFTKWNPKSICGLIASVSIDWNIPVIWSPNTAWTVAYLLFFDEEKRDRTYPIRLIKKSGELWEIQKGLIEGLPGVSGELSARLLEKFRTPRAVFCASENELCEVEGIGKVKSREIVRVLTTEWQKPPQQKLIRKQEVESQPETSEEAQLPSSGELL